jgi:protein-disulfide isomerase
MYLLAGLLVLGMAAGCKAQPSPQANDLTLNRHIEVLVRSQFNLPQEINVSIGARKPSQVAGYETLPITLSHGDKKSVVTFSLEKDAVFSIDIAGRPMRGNPAAKVTVINFDDLECPYCARMHQTLFPDTLNRYKDKVRFVYKDDPLAEMHPWAMHASINANCLAAQSGEAYWAFVDYVHSNGQEINGENREPAKSFDALNRIARQQGTLHKLDATALDACLTKQDETAVRASMKLAQDLRIEGTPALFIDGERIDGALPEAQVWMVIDRALRAQGIEPPATPAPAASK